MRTLITLCLLLVPLGALAQPSPTPAPTPAAAPATAAAPTDAPATAADAGEPTVEEVVEAGLDTVKAVRAASKDGSFAAWALAFAALFYLLIAAARKWLGLLVSPNAVRITTVVLGALAAIAGYIGAGIPWGEALQLFLAGPGAIVFAELRKSLPGG